MRGHARNCAKVFSCVNIQTSKNFGGKKKNVVSLALHPHALLGCKMFSTLTRTSLTEEYFDKMK